MDPLEFRVMISPMKKLLQRFFEFKMFKQLLTSRQVDLTKKKILEVGCGAGYGLELISNEFNPKKLVAFDIIPKLIVIAKQYTEQKSIPVKLFVGDILDIDLPSNEFDCVFCFTVLHHVPKWRQALKELNRVLKPNGVLLIDDHTKRSLDRLERFFKVKHSKDARFQWSEFKKEIINAGFKIIQEKKFTFGIGLNFLMSVKTKNIPLR
ncbi:MAG: class I SAM-dependent methyltransferase [Promethearchaeota archaeon]